MSKFYFKYDSSHTYSIDLKTNFGQYYNQSDTDCEFVGQDNGTKDSGYRYGNGNVIYAVKPFTWYIDILEFYGLSSTDKTISLHYIKLSNTLESGSAYVKIEEITQGGGSSGNYETKYEGTYNFTNKKDIYAGNFPYYGNRNLYNTPLWPGGMSDKRYAITIKITDNYSNEFNFKIDYMYHKVNDNEPEKHSIYTGKITATHQTTRNSTSVSNLEIGQTSKPGCYHVTTGIWNNTNS